MPHRTIHSHAPDRPSGLPPSKDMVWIPGGTFMMGSDDHYPEERPAHKATVSGFWMDAHQVTNARFRRFVKETGYVTIAEQAPRPEDYPDAIPEMLQAGSVIFRQPQQRVPLHDHYRWWEFVAGVNWRHPEGPESTLNGRDHHPVLHVAWEDVQAFATWAGADLPTEAEWERACRGGVEGLAYQWGDELAPKGKMLANYWQGEFPWQNLRLDGYDRVAPVGKFPPNQYGLFDMIGNAWEWTKDWYTSVHEVEACCDVANPVGGTREGSIDPRAAGNGIPRKVLKGGSWACGENYCRRYRPAARMHHPIDTGTNHLTFRLVIRPDQD